ncbi:hypothetical protein FDK33_22870 [Citrobacter werkmanii]|uniref:hypothetical protein n=1 Tax=Citrobacter freundii complex TaxID=1344959 RepID=UPI001D0A02EE|nr:hypothetical protein [Citrobacter werkmanii]MBQ4926199.1 hypothetical protein [Citrobacter werkmanii]MBQ4938499.1 hypothetical protein [Citrobacter werkmanii]MBQ4951857.1 hypothetical protein [Citrobacter werkmanii]MBQ4967230.1 hypothetical protein [Citrobacter werkmanii]
MTTNHPAHGPASLERLHQIREHLLHDTQYSNGGNRAYILADVLKVIDGAIAAFCAEPVLYAAEETLACAEMGELHLKCLSQPMGDAVIPLYTTPPAPVSVPDDVMAAMQKVAHIRLDLNDFDGDKRGILDCLSDAEETLIEVVNRRAAMLQAGNSLVTPDDLALVPKRLTAENGAKGVLSGEFSETKFINCPECFGDDECETCDGSGRIEITVPVSWTNIKAIWAKGVEHFEAAPQQENV